MSFKSSDQTTTTNQTSTTTPWAPQAAALQTAFNQANAALNKANQAVAPTQFTAQYTPEQLEAFQTMLNYGMGNSPSAASATAAGNALNTAGTTAAQAGFRALSGFTPDAIADQNIAAANKYVAGQDIPSLVDAAMLDARRNANENVLPALARQAAATGNINSSKNAIAQGIVERGLAEQAGALSAQLRGQAYDKGLDLGQQGTQAALSAALGQVSGGNNAVTTGTNAGASGVNQQAGLFDIANKAISNQYAAAQAPLTNAQQQFAAETNDPFAALMNYFNIVGARPLGATTVSNGVSNTQSTPSGASILGGLLTGLGSFL